ncbi:putative late promoter-activating protein (Gp10) [Escherichia coli B671]|nr:putative late promoter-activating protein (Gp10) [Escherichia coli B671]
MIMSASYEAIITKITSKEISDVMLKKRDWVTARDVADELRQNYPGRIVEINDVYKRIVEFAESHNAHCEVDLSTRPRRFRLRSIRREYFNELRRQLLRKGVSLTDVQRLLGETATTEEEVIRSWKYAHDMFDALFARRRG